MTVATVGTVTVRAPDPSPRAAFAIEPFPFESIPIAAPGPNEAVVLMASRSVAESPTEIPALAESPAVTMAALSAARRVVMLA